MSVPEADYLEHLLQAAMHGPGAAVNSAGGRIVAKLMLALAANGEDERLEPYLACSPGRRSVFEVTSCDEVDRPVARLTNLDAGDAIRSATKLAAVRPDCIVRVVANDGIGPDRCLLVARGPSVTYQFRTVDGVQGRTRSPDGGVSVWQSGPREAQFTALTERLDSLPTKEEVVTAMRDMLDEMTMDLWNRLGSLTTTSEITRALENLLGRMTIELDVTAIENAVYSALDELPHATDAIRIRQIANHDRDSSPAVLAGAEAQAAELRAAAEAEAAAIRRTAEEDRGAAAAILAEAEAKRADAGGGQDFHPRVAAEAAAYHHLKRAASLLVAGEPSAPRHRGRDGFRTGAAARRGRTARTNVSPPTDAADSPGDNPADSPVGEPEHQHESSGRASFG